MADTKLSALNELAATPAGSDELYIRDVSEPSSSESKRITVTNLLSGAPTATETIDSDSGNLGAGVTFTPGDSGIFFGVGYDEFSFEYQSTGASAWYPLAEATKLAGFSCIGDGINFRIKNLASSGKNYILFRHHIATTSTYERARDEDLASGATWTPGDSGFFSVVGEFQIGGGSIRTEINRPTDGWSEARVYPTTAQRPATMSIGDGTNWRVKNTHGSLARYHVTMRAKMT